MPLRIFRNYVDAHSRNDYQSQNKAVNVAKFGMVAARRETQPSAVGRLASGLRWQHSATSNEENDR